MGAEVAPRVDGSVRSPIHGPEVENRVVVDSGEMRGIRLSFTGGILFREWDRGISFRHSAKPLVMADGGS